MCDFVGSVYYDLAQIHRPMKSFGQSCHQGRTNAAATDNGIGAAKCGVKVPRERLET
jgi:hypothetical protein